MTTITKSLIEEIKQRSDIVSVISQYINVEQHGRSYRCICPFHNDHNPSMNISSEKQIFKCFSCGAGGDVIGFVKDYEKISFSQAVQKLGKELGIEIAVNSEEKPIDNVLQPSYDILQSTIDYASYILSTNDNAKNYLKLRNIDNNQIKKFEIGYDDGNLYRFLAEKNYSYELMDKVNLIYTTLNATKDVFEQRILFPIHNLEGQPVGFTARTIGNSNVKYINTSETEIYHKGQLLYNYHRMRNTNRIDRVYVVEGPLDVIAFDRAGIESAVATLGTAITSEQIAALKRLKKPILVCYDGDTAGRKATYKFGILASKYHLKFEIVQWESSLDPDEYLKQEGITKFNEQVQKTISWIQFLFDHLKIKYNLLNHSDKQNYAKEIASFIKEVEDQVEQKTYFDHLKLVSGFDYSQTVQHSKFNKPVKPIPLNHSQILTEELFSQMQLLLQSMLYKRAFQYCVQNNVVFPTTVCGGIFLKLVSEYEGKDDIDIMHLMSQFNEEERAFVEKMTSNPYIVKEFDERVIEDNLSVITRVLLQRQIEEIDVQMKTINDQKQRFALTQQKIELNKKIQDLKNKLT